MGQTTKINSMRLSLGPLSFDAASAHPNRMKFKGVLTRVDEASTKPPNGAQGHRIFMSSEVAKKRLSTLSGMGLNYAANLDGHAQRRKVGVIDKAWIEGKDLWVEGTIWKHDFPEAEKDLKQPGLGMSMEIGDVHIEDPHADVWNITDCCFLGGTILYKDSAAYYRTQAIAAKAAGGGTMIKPTLKKRAAKPEKTGDERIAEVVSAAIATALLPTISRQTKVMAGINASIASLSERIEASLGGEEDEEEVTSDVDAAGDNGGDGDGEDDGGDGDGEDDGEGDADGEAEVDAEEVADGEKPGTINKDTKNHGSDTEEDDKVGPELKKGVTGSAVRKLQAQMKQLEKKFAAQLAASQEQTKSLQKQLKATKVQVTAAAAETNRRSLSPELVALLSKANINADDIRASGMKLGVAEVDAVLAQTAGLDIETRMNLKTQFVRSGLMEEGKVERRQLQ